jgi:DNA helicase-2/ATP-dependent DNA helicase PcrA
LPWDEGLRPEQRSVAEHPRENAVLLAGPGTGKTHTLVRRIEWLIEVEEVPPRAITAITFTRASAAEMRHRLEKRLGQVARAIRILTLHSHALRSLLRKGGGALPRPLRVAGDWEEREVVVEELARLLGRRVSEIRNNRDGALDRLADDWDTLAIDGSGWEEGHPDPDFLGAWHRHREVYGYTLRGELVYQLLVELRSDPGFVPDPDIAVLLVDEYQDLNQCDLSAIRLLADRTGTETFVAGDDDQSIYSFRHAHPEGIRRFTEQYPAARRRTLGECLRCGPEIVELANWLIQQEPEREKKELVSTTEWDSSVHLIRFADQEEEAAGVARIVTNEVGGGTPSEEILVLVKSDNLNRIADAVAGELEESRLETYLPRATGVEDDDVHRLVGFLNLVRSLEGDRVDDLALRALLQLEDNSIGPDRLWRITELALDKGIRFSEAVRVVDEDRESYSRSRLGEVVDESKRILELAQSLPAQGDESFLDWVARLFESLEIGEDARVLVSAAASRVVDELRDLEPDAAADPGRGGEIQPDDFVQALTTALGNVSETLPPRVPGKVTLTTMHGAKGLSAECVVVLQAEDQILPDELTGAEYDESRRLLYVSLTRARRRLVITACRKRTGPQRFVGRREVSNRSLTRFLRDRGLEAESLGQYLKQDR